jgi:hypothetical protein
MFSKAKNPDSRLLRYDHIIVHCTATPPALLADAEWVNREHLRRGFANGCGYHAVITRYGAWQDRDDGFSTRIIGNEGAHVGDSGPSWNGRSFGISLAGGVDENNHPQDNFTAKQMATLEEGIQKILDIHPKPRTLTLLGHRDLIRITNAPAKACPSFDVQAWWAGLGHQTVTSTSAASIAYMPKPAEDLKAKPNDKMLLPATYAVKAGDTLASISEHYGVPVQRLKMLNNLINVNVIRIGFVLKMR